MIEVLTVEAGPSVLVLETAPAQILAIPESGPAVSVIEQAAPQIVALAAEQPQHIVGLIAQGPAGPSAFEDWLKRNPGGTWEEFLASLGTGALDAVIDFSFGDASPRVMFTLPQDSLLSELQLIIRQPFNGVGAKLVVRTNGYIILMDEDQNLPDFPTTYETTPAAILPAGSQIVLEITPGVGATAGTGQLLLNLQ